MLSGMFICRVDGPGCARRVLPRVTDDRSARYIATLAMKPNRVVESSAPKGGVFPSQKRGRWNRAEEFMRFLHQRSSELVGILRGPGASPRGPSNTSRLAEGNVFRRGEELLDVVIANRLKRCRRPSRIAVFIDQLSSDTFDEILATEGRTRYPILLAENLF